MASSPIYVVGYYSDIQFVYSAAFIDVTVAHCDLLRKGSYHFETFHQSVWYTQLLQSHA